MNRIRHDGSGPIEYWQQSHETQRTPEEEREISEERGEKVLNAYGDKLTNKYGEEWNRLSPRQRLKKTIFDIAAGTIIAAGITYLSVATQNAEETKEKQQALQNYLNHHIAGAEEVEFDGDVVSFKVGDEDYRIDFDDLNIQLRPND